MKNTDWGDLWRRLKFDSLSAYDMQYVNDADNQVFDYNRIHYEFVRSGFVPNAKPYKVNYPNCLSLKIFESPDLLNVTQFESLKKIKTLEIT